MALPFAVGSDDVLVQPAPASLSSMLGKSKRPAGTVELAERLAVHLNTVGRLAAVPLATDERLKPLPVAATTLTPIPHIVTDRVEVEPRGLVGWLTTTDHKRIWSAPRRC